mmetsp:Transcript_18325/g.56750  ORF Transcript_18325/g.56750 Transcript_18325/m.56750 type:complete len:243 (+) Transcript_18325:538-1266(+)
MLTLFWEATWRGPSRRRRLCLPSHASRVSKSDRAEISLVGRRPPTSSCPTSSRAGGRRRTGTSSGRPPRRTPLLNPSRPWRSRGAAAAATARPRPRSRRRRPGRPRDAARVLLPERDAPVAQDLAERSEALRDVVVERERLEDRRQLVVVRLVLALVVDDAAQRHLHELGVAAQRRVVRRREELRHQRVDVVQEVLDDLRRARALRVEHVRPEGPGDALGRVPRHDDAVVLARAAAALLINA